MLITQKVRRFLADDEGAALVEYGLLVLLIAVLCIVAIRTMGSKISNTFNTVNISLP
jgi:pilus assembly protein Flp/PilA